MSQEALNREIEELRRKIERTLPSHNAQLIRSASQTRLTVTDILAKYANSDGTIPREKLGAVLSELQAVEAEIYRNLRDELRLMLQDTATSTTTALSIGVMAAIDTATLMSVAGVTGTAAALGAGAAYLLFEALTGRTREDFSDSIARTPFNRVGDDGKRLNDRLREIARILVRDISDTLRKSIRNREVTTGMVQKIKKSFNALAERLQTLVETEIHYVMRNGIATFAEVSGIAKGLRIKDYPHGDPAEHQKHMCYIYARRNDYGLGVGVYPVSNRKIRNPHPRCRSTLHIVLKDQLA